MSSDLVNAVSERSSEAGAKAAYEFFVNNNMFPVLNRKWEDLDEHDKRNWHELNKAAEQASWDAITVYFNSTCKTSFIPFSENSACPVCLCDQEQNHKGKHHCPECDTWWSLASEEK